MNNSNSNYIPRLNKGVQPGSYQGDKWRGLLGIKVSLVTAVGGVWFVCCHVGFQCGDQAFAQLRPLSVKRPPLFPRGWITSTHITTHSSQNLQQSEDRRNGVVEEGEAGGFTPNTNHFKDAGGFACVSGVWAQAHLAPLDNTTALLTFYKKES